MDRWQNRVAVVTGASSGLGVAIVKDLLKAGVVVAALARRKERIDEYRSQLPAEQQKRLHAVRCDVSAQESVNEAFDWIVKELGGVDILVNNAGTWTMGQLSTMDVAVVQNTLQVNVMGVVYCTRRAFKSMKERKFDGHVVIVNSIAGHHIPQAPDVSAIMNIYPPTKFAVTAIAQIFKQEFSGADTKIKVTSVSPGMTDTEIVPDAFKASSIMLKPEDVSQCVLFAISTPQSVQISEITIVPNSNADI